MSNNIFKLSTQSADYHNARFLGNIRAAYLNLPRPSQGCIFPRHFVFFDFTARCSERSLFVSRLVSLL